MILSLRRNRNGYGRIDRRYLTHITVARNLLSDRLTKTWSSSMVRMNEIRKGVTRMRRSRFTEQQIVAALRQAESGTSVVEVCRKLGITEQTFYRWKRKFAAMGVAELRRLQEVEEENRRLKQLVADLTLDKQMLQEALRKNW
jgi:putative transposase